MRFFVSKINPFLTSNKSFVKKISISLRGKNVNFHKNFRQLNLLHFNVISNYFCEITNRKRSEIKKVRLPMSETIRKIPPKGLKLQYWLQWYQLQVNLSYVTFNYQFSKYFQVLKIAFLRSIYLQRK